MSKQSRKNQAKRNDPKRKRRVETGSAVNELPVPAAKKSKGIPERAGGSSRDLDEPRSREVTEPPVPDLRATKGTGLSTDTTNRQRLAGQRVCKVPALEVLDIVHFRGRYATFRPEALENLAQRGRIQNVKILDRARRRKNRAAQAVESGKGASGAVPQVASLEGGTAVGQLKAQLCELYARIAAIEKGSREAIVVEPTTKPQSRRTSL